MAETIPDTVDGALVGARPEGIDPEGASPEIAAPAKVDKTVPRIFAFLARLMRHPRLVLTLLCLLLWAPGVFSLPPLDRDESRFAEASKQMVESGDIVDIRFGTVPRYKKPVGIYWAQAGLTAAVDKVSGVVTHNRIWTYRLASLIGGIVAVWLTYWTASALLAPQGAFIAGLLMALSTLLLAESSIATTDAVLLACILAGQGVFLRVYKAVRDGQTPPSVWFCLCGWLALGLATLVKGPMALPIAGLTYVFLSLWDGGWRRFDGGWGLKTHPHRGIILLLAIVAPWAIAIAARSNGAFYDQALGHDFAAKLAGGQESHGGSPGYYFLLLWLTFWPATLGLVQGVVLAVRRRQEPVVRFLIAWILPAWLMFEAVPTKLPHYVLPLYPALAILAAVWLTSQSRGVWRERETLFDRIGFVLGGVVYALGAIVLAVAALLLPKIYGHGLIGWQIAVVAVFAVFSLLAMVAYFRRLMLTAITAVLLSLVAMYPLVTAGIGPGLEKIWISPRAAAATHALSVAGDPPPKMAGYIEPSLFFLLGSDTRLTDGTGAAEAGAAEGGLALVEKAHQASFLAKLADLQADAVVVGEVDGLNYSRGRLAHIIIYRITPVRDLAPIPPSE